jgi:hypothetical protein
MNRARMPYFTRACEHDQRSRKLRQRPDNGRRRTVNRIGNRGLEMRLLVANGLQIPRRNDQPRFFATIRLFLWSKVGVTDATTSTSVIIPEGARGGRQRARGVTKMGATIPCASMTHYGGERPTVGVSRPVLFSWQRSDLDAGFADEPTNLASVVHHDSRIRRRHEPSRRLCISEGRRIGAVFLQSTEHWLPRIGVGKLIDKHVEVAQIRSRGDQEAL